jgi:regulator of sigma E protease
LAYRFAAPDISKVLITDVAEDTPAFSAGILPGDVVLSVDRVSIDSFDSMVDAVTDRVGTETELQMDRDGEIISVFLTPRETFPDDQGPLGVSLGNPSMIMPWGQAINFGLQSTWSQFEGILQLPGRLLSGNIEPEDARLSGLKGMYDMIAWAGSIDRSSQRPFLTLNLIGVISVGLAIANLLPFPALDGGRLVFVFLELILRKRIEPRYEGLAHTIGFGLLLVILIYVNLLDFIRPISLP